MVEARILYIEYKIVRLTPEPLWLILEERFVKNLQIFVVALWLTFRYLWFGRKWCVYLNTVVIV